jgi:hypothetical protein
LFGKDFSKDFLLSQGLITDSSITEEAAIANVRSRIGAALTMLNNEWIREKGASSAGDDFMGMGGGFGGAMDPMTRLLMMRMTGAGTLAQMMDMNYDVDRIMEHKRCPASLKELQLEGLYHFMQLPDSAQNVSFEKAKMMESMLGKVDEFCDWEGQKYEDDDTCSTSLRKFFGRCEEGYKIVG